MGSDLESIRTRLQEGLKDGDTIELVGTSPTGNVFTATIGMIGRAVIVKIGREKGVPDSETREAEQMISQLLGIEDVPEEHHECASGTDADKHIRKMFGGGMG